MTPPEKTPLSHQVEQVSDEEMEKNGKKKDVGIEKRGTTGDSKVVRNSLM